MSLFNVFIYYVCWFVLLTQCCQYNEIQCHCHTKWNLASRFYSKVLHKEMCVPSKADNLFKLLIVFFHFIKDFPFLNFLAVRFFFWFYFVGVNMNIMKNRLTLSLIRKTIFGSNNKVLLCRYIVAQTNCSLYSLDFV